MASTATTLFSSPNSIMTSIASSPPSNNNSIDNPIHDPAFIISITLVSLLMLIFGPIICCVCANRKTERANKLQYFRDKESEPSLTYAIWKERKTQALELQESDEEFRRFKEREESAEAKAEAKWKAKGKGKGQENRQGGPKNSERGFSAFFKSSGTSTEEGFRRGGAEEDGEALIESQIGTVRPVKMTPRRSNSTSQAPPPPYSSLLGEEQEQQRD